MNRRKLLHPGLALPLPAPGTASQTAAWHWKDSSSNRWTTAANWSNRIAPVAGDALIFPSGGLNQTNSNNFANGTVFGQIRLTDDYVLKGNRVALTNAPGLGLIGTGVSSP